MSTFETIGYNESERQFHEKDQELLQKLRAQLDEQRAAAKAAQKPANWMKCPKCGGQLAEKPMGSVLVDQCGGCGGVWLDAGELAMLVGHHGDGDRSRMLDDVLGWIPGWQKGRKYFTKG